MGQMGKLIALPSESLCLWHLRLGQGKGVGRTIWPRGCSRDCKETSTQRAQHLQQACTTPLVGPKPARSAYWHYMHSAHCERRAAICQSCYKQAAMYLFVITYALQVPFLGLHFHLESQRLCHRVLQNR